MQESPQSVDMELASIASDSHLILVRYWMDSFNISSSSSSNTTASESGMPLNLCLLISHRHPYVLLLLFAISHGLIYLSYVLLQEMKIEQLELRLQQVEEAQAALLARLEQ